MEAPFAVCSLLTSSWLCRFHLVGDILYHRNLQTNRGFSYFSNSYIFFRENPKSTASGYETGFERVRSTGEGRCCSKKDIRSQPERVLLARACLTGSASGFLDKILLPFFRDPIFVYLVDRCICYPDGKQPSSIIRCRAFTSTSSEG